MAGGLSTVGQQRALDACFLAAGSHKIEFSTDGSAKFAGVADTVISWSAATAATPSVTTHASALLTAAFTAGGAITHWRAVAPDGQALTDWTPLATARSFAVGDRAELAAQALQVTLD